jgi:cytochrome c oxidase subunit 3
MASATLARPPVEQPGIELAEQFTTVEQQRHVAKLGMWAWLVTELLLFAGLFLTALVIRIQYPGSAEAASSHLKMWIGAINSVVLIISSLCMTAAIELSKMGRSRDVTHALLATGGLGLLFLCFKTFEYYVDWSEHMMPFLNRPYALGSDSASQLFVDLYYITTGLHFVHLSIGIGLVTVLALQVRRSGFLHRHQNHVEITGLYWHFIDLIWLIAFPTLYMVNR